MLSTYFKFDLRLNERSTYDNRLLLEAAMASAGKKEFPNKELCFILGGRNIVLIFDADAVDYAPECQDIRAF